jgi:hypothetical protein
MEDQKGVTKSISVSVPQDIFDWLEEHQKINRSKIFQDAMKIIMNPKKRKIPPQLMYTCTLGFVVGISLMIASYALIWLFGVFWSYTFIFLGMALSLSAILTLYKEKREIDSGKLL